MVSSKFLWCFKCPSSRLSLVFFWLACGEPLAQNSPWSRGSVLFGTSKLQLHQFSAFAGWWHYGNVHQLNFMAYVLCKFCMKSPKQGSGRVFLLFPMNIRISMNSWRSWIPCTVDVSCFLLGDAAKTWSDDAAGGLNCASGCGAVKPPTVQWRPVT